MTEKDDFDLDQALADWDAAFDRETKRPEPVGSDRPTSPPSLDSGDALFGGSDGAASPFGEEERSRSAGASRLADELLPTRDRKSDGPFGLSMDEGVPRKKKQRDDATVSFSVNAPSDPPNADDAQTSSEVAVSKGTVDRNLSFDDDVTKIANIEVTEELLSASADVLAGPDDDDLLSIEIDEENIAEVHTLAPPASPVDYTLGDHESTQVWDDSARERFAAEASRDKSDDLPTIEIADVTGAMDAMDTSAMELPDADDAGDQSDTDAAAVARITGGFTEGEEFDLELTEEAAQRVSDSNIALSEAAAHQDKETDENDLPEFEVDESSELDEEAAGALDDEDADFPEFEVDEAAELDEFPEFEVGEGGHTSARMGAAQLTLTPPPKRERTSPLLDSLDDEAVADDLAEGEQSEGGASTAKRTVTRRKPRREVFALVGRDPEAQNAQVTLLKALADKSETYRGALLHSAAEHAMALGDVTEARELLSEAEDLVALRMRRRDALASADFSAAEDLLQQELTLPLSKTDEAAASSTLAELRMSRLSDLEGAEVMAARAYAAQPSYENTLLLMGVRHAQGNTLGAAAAAEAFRNQESEVNGSSDREQVAELMAAMIFERADETGKARALYRSLIDSRYKITAMMALERLDEISLGASALEQPDDALSEALRRLVAAKQVAAGVAKDALSTIAGGTRPSTARLRAKAAFFADDQHIRAASLETLAASSGGRERALALVDLAETRVAMNDVDAAEKALRDASLADSELGTVDVVREVLARRLGDADRLTQAVTARAGNTGQGSVEAAAKWVSPHTENASTTKLEREAELLERALEEAVAPLTADTLLYDVHNELQSDEALEFLRRYAERAEGKARVSALLALAAREEDPAPVFDELRAIMPSAPLVSRTVARFFGSSDPFASAQASLDEADTATADRSTYAAIKAARTFLRAGERERAIDAAQQAFLIAPGDGPAAWVLLGDLADGLEAEALSVFLEELGDAAIDPIVAAEAHVLAALSGKIGAPSDAFDQASFERASDFVPEDLLLALRTLTGANVTPSARDAALQTLIIASAEDSRTLSLLAGEALLKAGDFSAASKRYEAQAEAARDPLVERLLDRADLAAGKLPSIAARRLGRVRESQGTDAAVAALEDLAAIDLYERDNPRAAYLTLQTIRDAAPAHLPTLRAIERYTMNQGTAEGLRYSSEDMLRALTDQEGSRDRLAYLRSIVQSIQFEPDGSSHSSDMLVGEFEALRSTATTPAAERRWLAEELLIADSLDDDLRGSALPAVTSSMQPDIAAATYYLHEDVARAAQEPGEIATLLRDAEGDGHEYLSRFRGDLLADAELPEDAGLAYARAAKLAHTDALKLELHVAAAAAFQKSGAGDREKVALEAVAELNIAQPGVFERLEAVYRRDNETEKLAALVDQRVLVGADEGMLQSLARKQAELRMSGGDKAGAKEALTAVLRYDPKDQKALRQLAELQIADEDWKGAARILVHFARLTEDRTELQWVFRELGTIYDKHEPDAERAEAAYRRAIRLDPDDTQTIKAIADFYERQENWDGALKAYEGLYRREIDPDAKVGHVLAGARVLEKSGDHRRAERTLVGQLRSDHDSLPLIKALAEFYRRQNAGPALAMHLSRSTTELAKAAKREPAEPGAWEGLMEVLTWRGHTDAASVVASAALANGIESLSFESLDEFGGAGGLGRAALRKDVLERLAPAPLSLATFDVFRQTAHVVDAVIPVDLTQWGASPLPARFTELHSDAHQIAAWFDQSQVELFETQMLPHVAMPLSLNPLRILIGSELAHGNVREENRFLLTRAIAIASSNLACTVRIPPEQLNLFLVALVRQIQPDFLGGADPGQVAHAERAVTRHVPVLKRESMRPAIREMSGAQEFSAAALTEAALSFGNRIALLATGNVALGAQAILRVNGRNPARRVQVRQEALKQDNEASRLIEYAISNRHFELRRELGRSR